MKVVQQLKEVDIVSFHRADAPKDVDNGAFEMITHGGQHIKTYSLPCSINGELKFARALHRDTYYELLNRLFGLGIQINRNEIFQQKVRDVINFGERPNLGDGYYSPEICIIHFNENKNNDKNQGILVFIPGYVTPLQFETLTTVAEDYTSTIIGNIGEVSIEFLISKWDPRRCEENEALKYIPESFEEVLELLRDNNRIQDYDFPFKEQIVYYDVPLKNAQFSKR